MRRSSMSYTERWRAALRRQHEKELADERERTRRANQEAAIWKQGFELAVKIDDVRRGLGVEDTPDEFERRSRILMLEMFESMERALIEKGG